VLDREQEDLPPPAPGLTSGLPSRQSHPADDVADQDGDQHLDPGVPGAVEPPHHRLLLVRQVRAKINPAFNLYSRLLCSICLFFDTTLSH